MSKKKKVVVECPADVVDFCEAVRNTNHERLISAPRQPVGADA